jgi:acyl phosphate:glycerol-3-phosphate acyltransferase
MDVRSEGSGNIGATNVARVAGARLGIAVLLLDIAKGAVPVLIARGVGVSSTVVALSCLCAFFGHIFPIFARFQGGKGVATAAGCFLAATPAAVGCAVVVFVAVVAFSRIVSLASIAAGLSLPVFTALLRAPRPLLWAAVAVAGSLLVTHRDNLRRLRAGEEPRFRSRN